MRKYKSTIFLLTLCLFSCLDGSNLSKTSSKIGQSEVNYRYKKPKKLDVFEGKVIKIVDGDTFDLMLEDTTIRVRFNGIDCPERGQAYGKKASKTLADLIASAIVQVQWLDNDRYRRWIVDVFYTNKNINHEMVALGMAWHYKKYSSDETLDFLEKEARQKKVGLWAEPNPTPPWAWRKREKK